MSGRRTAPFGLWPALCCLSLWGCNDGSYGEFKLQAKAIERADEIIGGPTSRGKVGDFLIENDKVRFIVSGKDPSWMGGVFGGTLVDADIQRWRPDVRYGKGWDSFAETFPLVNLLVTNPNLDSQEAGLTDQGAQLIAIPSDITVIKDGSDGEAIVRVTGRAGYMFEVLQFLNKDFLRSYLGEPFDLGGIALPIDELVKAFLGVDIYALINRLQLDFRFTNDYILHQGEAYLTMRTTIISAPPSEEALSLCPSQGACDLDCEYGMALAELDIETEDKTTKVLCPLCACAEEPREMASLNESEDIFKIMLGDLDRWTDPSWKGGMLGGDFLFFGSEANIFTPGLGFDENKKIFENMWQGVPTLASPLMFDWIAAVADNVSYGWVTKNPDRREGSACPSHRIAITAMGYDREAEVIAILVDELGLDQMFAETKVRQVIVDRKPLPLKDVPTGAGDFAAWQADVLASEPISDEDPRPLASLFPEGVTVSLVGAADCLSAKLLIPVFSTSATAVMTHKSLSSMELDEDGTPVDKERAFTFERYLVVGGGDVGSVLTGVYSLKGEAVGTVSGVVMEEGSGNPVQHAEVFALLDPRAEASDPAPATYDEVMERCLATFGHTGLVSQMETDLGDDPTVDGTYSGPLLPGRYLLVAFSKGRGVSRPVAVTVTEGQRAVAHLTIPREGRVDYMVQDDQGLTVPSRLSFVSLDEDGQAMRWDGKNHVELGGSRYDHGIYLTELSDDGQGRITIPAGRYDVYVSRGFEYSIDRISDFEVKEGQTVTLSAFVAREVDTTGYISGDFHVHARASIDSSLPLEDRVTANAVEGLEFITATDHDYLTDYTPYINELNLEAFMTSAVGVETTTLEFGHYNGFPMEYDETAIPAHDPPPWYGNPIDVVWDMMRDRAQKDIRPEDFVVQVNHPRDGFMGYFAQFGLKGYSLERETPGMEMCNPATERIACNFDAIELMNEKRFELLRTPTIAEKQAHNDCYGAIMGASTPSAFAVDEADPEASTCGVLQMPPHQDCDTLEQVLTEPVLGLGPAENLSRRDACRWHREFRGQMGVCSQEKDTAPAKRCALEALKLLTVRYHMERTPRELEAYYATTAETDLGCDYKAAMAGCEANIDDDGAPQAGCDECSCETCVCDSHPGCCQEPDEGGTGWTAECAELCGSECLGCGIQPCTSMQQVWEDWFSFLNHGFNVTALGNSDSHDLKSEVGLPRNYVASSTDDPAMVNPSEIYRSIKEHRAIISTGPFVEFTINDQAVGSTLTSPPGPKLQARIRVQTASWFGVDRIEIYRNGMLENIVRLEPDPAALLDFDSVVELTMPEEDSWYAVATYGLDSKYLMSPVYKRNAYGHLLISSILSMGLSSILYSFGSLLDRIPEDLLSSLLGDLTATSEMPDSFPMFPLALTNPIWVDLGGDGFDAPWAVDSDGDGKADLPPFCSRPCDVEIVQDEDGNDALGQSICGQNQVCLPDGEGDNVGQCAIPIPDNCVGLQVEN